MKPRRPASSVPFMTTITKDFVRANDIDIHYIDAGATEVADCSSTPLHRLRHRQGFIGDHRLQRGGRALLGGSDGGISISKRRQHLDGQLLQAPVTLGRVHDDASHTPRMLPASLPASMSACPYLLPSSTETRIPYGFSGRPSGHHLRCSLNGVLPLALGLRPL